MVLTTKVKTILLLGGSIPVAATVLIASKNIYSQEKSNQKVIDSEQNIKAFVKKKNSSSKYSYEDIKRNSSGLSNFQ